MARLALTKNSPSCYDSGMKNSTKNMLRGIGSLLVIMPTTQATDYSRFMPQGTAAERIEASWNRVGDSLRTAMGQYEQQTSQKKTSR